MISKLTIYKSSCFDPYINLAIEKYLFDNVKHDELILYLWQNENTVVIGSNQNPWVECRSEELEKDNVHLARRLSGGGAVFHDKGNLNFTFLCSTQNYNLELQLKVIKLACKMTDIEAEISGRNDILTDGKKISGNAFYNSKGKSYHHGTILINTDFTKLERYLTPNKEKIAAKSIKSVKSRVTNLVEYNPSLTPETMTDLVIKAAEEVYGLKAVEMPTISEDYILPIATKISSWEYLYGKTIPFTTSFGAHFDWGTFNLNMIISQGQIKEIQLFTDSMDWLMPKKLESALVGCPLQQSAIKDSLHEHFEPIVANDIFTVISNNLFN